MKNVEMVSDLIFNMKRNLKIIHVFIHDKKLQSFFVSVSSGPHDNFNDLIDYVTVYSEPKEHADKHINDLRRISTLNITIRYVSNGIYSPIQRIKILPSPRQFYYWCICRRVKNPTNLNHNKKLHVGSNIPLI